VDGERGLGDTFGRFAFAVWAFGLGASLPRQLGAFFAAAGTTALLAGLVTDRSPTRTETTSFGASPLWLGLEITLLGSTTGALIADRAVPAGLGPAMAVVGATSVSLMLVTAAWVTAPPPAGRRSMILALLMAALFCGLVAAGTIVVRSLAGRGDDVFWLHTQAARALHQGQNPYGPAVNVPDGSPLASPSDRITGYPYPPFVAAVYALGSAAYGDPRGAGLASSALALLALGIMALRADRVTPRGTAARVALLAFLASSPAWTRVIAEGWTEPLSLLLLTLAALSWERPLLSSMALGLALGSKQYFVAAVPLLFAALSRQPRGRLRIGVALATATFAVLPGWLANPHAFTHATVWFHLSRPPRTDSASLISVVAAICPGTGWPRAISAGGLLLGVIGGVALAWTRNTASGFWAALAFTMSLVFFFAPQAFANYWYLAAWLAALAAFCTVAEATARGPTAGSD